MSTIDCFVLFSIFLRFIKRQANKKKTDLFWCFDFSMRLFTWCNNFNFSIQNEREEKNCLLNAEISVTPKQLKYAYERITINVWSKRIMKVREGVALSSIHGNPEYNTHTRVHFRTMCRNTVDCLVHNEFFCSICLVPISFLHVFSVTKNILIELVLGQISEFGHMKWPKNDKMPTGGSKCDGMCVIGTRQRFKVMHKSGIFKCIKYGSKNKMYKALVRVALGHMFFSLKMCRKPSMANCMVLKRKKYINVENCILTSVSNNLLFFLLFSRFWRKKCVCFFFVLKRTRACLLSRSGAKSLLKLWSSELRESKE